MKIPFKILLFLLVICIQTTYADSITSIKNIQKQLINDVFENPDRAIVNADKILKSKHNYNNQSIISLYIIKSDAYVSKREYSKALKELELSKNFISEDGSEASIFNKIKLNSKISTLYYQMRLYENSLTQIEQYVNLFDKLPKVDSISLLKANTLTIKALIYRDKLNCDVAFSYFKDAIHIFESLKTRPAKINLSIVYYNYANCFVKVNDYASAEKYYNLSYNLSKELAKGTLQAYPLKGLGTMYSSKGNYNKSLEYLHQAEEISKSVGDRVLRREIFKEISDNYLKINDIKNFKIYNDKTIIEENLVRNSELNYINSTINGILLSEHNKTESLNKEYNDIIKIVFALFTIILLLLIYLIIKYYKKTNKIKISV